MPPEQRPWYREPMVWLVITFPLTAVVAGIATYIIADRTRDGLVVDDYYKQGKEINRVLARDVAASRHGLHARLQIEAVAHQVHVRVSAKPGVGLPPVITLRWLHGTRSGFDRTLALQRQADGTYRADLPALAAGHWYVQLEAGDWRLQSSMHIPSEDRLEFKTPGASAGH